MTAVCRTVLVLLALTIPSWTAAAWAAAPPALPQPGRFPVAVIDVQEVLNNHARFKVMQSEMKADVARAEQRLKAEGDEIKKMAEGLKAFLPGTRDYLDQQDKINKRAEDLKAQVQIQKAEFLQREAKNYHAVYREIVEEVARYAAEHGIEVVLRTTAPQKTETPEQVLQDMNKQVVWFAAGRDITQAVVERLNQKAGEKPAETKPQQKVEEKKAP